MKERGKMEKEEKTIYEIRRGGETVCHSNIPMLGYSAKLLRQMVADGYRYYADGKMKRRIDG